MISHLFTAPWGWERVYLFDGGELRVRLYGAVPDPYADLDSAERAALVVSLIEGGYPPGHTF